MATLLARGEWFGASLGVLVTMALLWSGWRTYRSRPESQARAWYAEWYAAQRLAGTA